MSSFADYLTWDRHKLLSRLGDIAAELAELYTEQGYTRAAELSKRLEQWSNPREDSVTGRVEDARYAAAVETISIIELEAREKALVEEKFFVIRLYEHLDGLPSD